MLGDYIPEKYEKKWQDFWETNKIFHTEDGAKDKPPYYCLMMFP